MKLETFPLDVEYDDSGRLFFEGAELKANVRTLEQMLPVLYDKEFSQTAEKSREEYYMYRSVCRKQDEHLFKEHSLSYDITIIPGIELGREFNKTFGHYHPKSPAGTHYPELYEILEGEVHYLLQKRNEAGKVDEVLLVKAKKGDKVLMPSGYGHISINPSNKMLVSANIVSTAFQSDYAPYKEREGGAYYELIDDSLIPNEKYEDLPMIKTMEASELAFNTPFYGENIYAQFVQNPEKFEFLKH